MDVFRQNLGSLASAMCSAGVTKITITYSGQDNRLALVGPTLHWPENAMPLHTDDHAAMGDIEVMCDVYAFNDEIGEFEVTRQSRLEPFDELAERLFNEMLRMSEMTGLMFAESTYGVFTINPDKTCSVTFRVPLEDTHVVTYSMSMTSAYPKRSTRELKPAKVRSAGRAKKSTTK